MLTNLHYFNQLGVFVVFEHEPKNIGEHEGSPSLIHTFDTSYVDPTTDTSEHVMNSEIPKQTKKFRIMISKSYVDCLSDNEVFSAGNSDLWSMNESERSINRETKKKEFQNKKNKDNNEKSANITEMLIKQKTKKENESKLREKRKMLVSHMKQDQTK